MIWAPHFAGIFLTLWKISQASRFEATPKFPYFTIVDKASYADTPTKQYDREAMRYMCYALYPCMFIYAIYSAIYNSHKSWYSFILNTLVGAIYLFGFIEMTPQLYINYKLKSVDHLP